MPRDCAPPAQFVTRLARETSMELPCKRAARALMNIVPCGIALCAMPLITSCHDSVSPVPVSTLSGTVVLQDPWTTRLDSFAGVSVAVDGVPKTATTDAAGAWHIDSVPAGKHNVTFSKATFGTVRLNNQAVNSPATVVPIVTMGITPWQQAVIDSIYLATRSGKDYYVVDGHLSAIPGANARLVYTVALFGTSAAVSPDAGGFETEADLVSPNGLSSTFSIPLPASVAQKTFGSGAQMFVTTYVSAMGCTCYANELGEKPYFSNIGPRGNVVQVSIK